MAFTRLFFGWPLFPEIFIFRKIGHFSLFEKSPLRRAISSKMENRKSDFSEEKSEFFQEKSWKMPTYATFPENFLSENFQKISEKNSEISRNFPGNSW